MSPFFQTLRESLEIVIIIYIVSHVLTERKGLFYILSLMASLGGAVFSVLLFPSDSFWTGTLIRFSFIFYAFLLLIPLSSPPPILSIFTIPVLFFINTFQLIYLLMEGLELNGPSIYIQGASGLMVTAGLYLLLGRIKLDLRKFMNPQEMLLFIATLSILTGGSREFLKVEMIPSMERGLRFFLEDLFNIVRDYLLIPSGENIIHPAVEFMEFLSSDRFAMALTAVIVLLPPVVLFIRLLLSPEPELRGEKKASIRKNIALYRKELLMRGTPLITSFVLLFILLHAANLSLNPSHEPSPVTIMAEDGILRVPLKDASGDISDMRLRKYSFMYEGVVYRIDLMMRPDGEVVACLDACEICPPRGYLQRGRYLICKYCNTPVPAESFGLSGGCNPIPLPSVIDNDTLVIRVHDVVEASKKAGSKFRGRH